jgi:ATP-dependent protease ClpP protease subunit
MPAFAEIHKEIYEGADPQRGILPDFDGVRRKYLVKLHHAVGKRAVIVYASAFLEDRPPSRDWQVNNLDMNGFMAAVQGVKQRELDLILHTPGGDPDAAQAILAYLRTRFDHIRAIVPQIAMSAGSMLALGCDEIVMGEHSQLGPIDPQFTISTPQGTRQAPAAEILQQFEDAKREIQKDPSVLPAWAPILAGMGPGLLSMCRTATERSQQMVEQWLKRYMFDGEADAEAKAGAVGAEFGDYRKHGSHGNPIRVDQAEQMGLKVTRLEGDDQVQDLVLSVHHAVMLALNAGVQKLIENHAAKAYFRTTAQPQGQLLLEVAPAPGPPPPRLTGRQPAQRQGPKRPKRHR